MILKLFDTPCSTDTPHLTDISRLTPNEWYRNLTNYMHGHCQGNDLSKIFNDILGEYNATFDLNGIVLKFETNEDMIRFLLKWA